jgi:hypothetical protein
LLFLVYCSVARRIDLIPLLRTQLCLTRKITEPGFFLF